MADLFESLFSPFGHVARYPREAKLVGYEWNLECDLDDSFEFLLAKPAIAELEAISRTEIIAFLAGLFDAEGSVLLHDKRGRYNPETAFSGADESLMRYVDRSLRILGYHSKLDWVIQAENRQGITGYSREGRVIIWRFLEAQGFLRSLPIRHREKVEKAKIVQQMIYRSDAGRNLEDRRKWKALVAKIEAERLAFIELAKNSLELSNSSVESLSSRSRLAKLA